MHSLRLRLFAAFALVIVIAVAAVAVYVRDATIVRFDTYVQVQTVPDQEIISALLSSYKQYGPDGLAGIVDKLSNSSGQRILVLDTGGRVLDDSSHILTGQSPDLSALPVAGGFNVRVGDAAVKQDTPVRILMLPQNTAPARGFTLFGRQSTAAVRVVPAFDPPAQIKAVAGPQGGATFAGGPNPESDFVGAVDRSLLLAGGLAGLAALSCAALLSNRILRPVRALTLAAGRLEGGNLGERVPVAGKDEIAGLARAFNAMAAGLERSETLRRTMVVDVAHDLRTPLTNVRGYLEAIGDGVVQPTPAVVASLHEEVMLLHRLIDDLQDLAQADAGQLRLACEPVAVERVAQGTIEAMRPQAMAKELTLRLDAPADLPLAQADAGRLGQILRNLIQNAITHTQADGDIVVTTTPTPDAMRISVRDTGCGIAPEHLPNVFERFYRADSSRTRATGGSGLGLAIVKQLVQAQGGTVDIVSTEGLGTTVSFTLPLARDAPCPTLPQGPCDERGS